MADLRHEEFDQLLKNRSEYKKTRENNYKNGSKERLSKILKKKVETTMIGALSSIEEHFGFLWSTNDGQLTDQQSEMYDIYQPLSV